MTIFKIQLLRYLAGNSKIRVLNFRPNLSSSYLSSMQSWYISGEEILGDIRCKLWVLHQ